MPQIRHTPRLAEVGGFPLHVVDARTPFEVRHRLAHVAIVAHRTMTDYPAGYDGTLTEDDQRLYLLADGTRAVAMVLTALDERFWPLCWRPGGPPELVGSRAIMRTGPKVARVWVAKDYRGRGLATELTLEVLRQLPCAIEAIGWEMPFTPGGRALVRRLRETEFLGCGDPHSLQQVLDGEDD
jgi:hypothetical protein